MKINTKRLLAVMLSVFVAMGFMVPFTQTASAASKTKTFYVTTQTKTVYKNEDGSKETFLLKYKYNKNGLVTEAYSKGYVSDGSTTKYTRNSAGIVKTAKTYDKDGKQIEERKGTIKNGKVTKSRTYTFIDGKKKLAESSTFTYTKKGQIKKEVVTHEDYGKSTYIYTYWPNGNTKKMICRSSDYKYVENFDKKGNLTSTKTTYGTGEYKTTTTATYKYKFNKKGYVTKEVVTEKMTDASGNTTKTVRTYTYKYTYNKAGYVKREESNYTSKTGDHTYKSSSVTTYKYKKVKVPKKYWKFFE